jgi:hypothetical protein
VCCAVAASAVRIRSGRIGRRFKSCHPDQVKQIIKREVAIWSLRAGDSRGLAQRSDHLPLRVTQCKICGSSYCDHYGIRNRSQVQSGSSRPVRRPLRRSTDVHRAGRKSIEPASGRGRKSHRISRFERHVTSNQHELIALPAYRHWLRAPPQCALNRTTGIRRRCIPVAGRPPLPAR